MSADDTTQPPRGSGPPKQLGPFRLVRALGSATGSGALWLAEVLEDRASAARGTGVAIEICGVRLLADAPSDTSVDSTAADTAPRARPWFPEVMRILESLSCEEDGITYDIAVRAFPQRIGPFSLVRQLGRAGGQGSVWLADVVDDMVPYATAGTQVALKFIRIEQLSDSKGLDRAQREWSVAAQVNHPAVVRIHEFRTELVAALPCSFLVMEYVPGPSLADALRRERDLPEKRLRALGERVARGLDALHSKGIVHRDVKPPNIVITASGDVRLVDLGLARRIDDSAPLTSGPHQNCSQAYAAPELFKGIPASNASDLYALGVVLYEAAAGHNPFAGLDVLATGEAHATLTLVPLNEGDPRIPESFAAFVTWLLKKSPDDRPPSAHLAAEILAQGDQSHWWIAQQAPDRRARMRRHDRLGPPPATDLVGRERELAALKAAAERARQGDGAVLLLEGEAGIGKTRLVDEFLLEAGAGTADTHVFSGGYPPGGSRGSLGAIGDALRRHFGAASLERRLESYLGTLGALAPGLASMVTGVPTPAGSELPNPQAVDIGLTALTRGLALEKLLIWVVDDVHFANDDDWRLIQTLARATNDQPMLLVVTFRPSDALANQLTALQRAGRAERVELQRLRPDDVEGLLAKVLGSATVAERLAPALATKSDCNPYFLVELAHELERCGALVEDSGGRFLRAGALDALRIPASLKDFLRARLCVLEPADREILEVGSVQGATFDAELAAHVLDRDAGDVLKALAAIEKRGDIIHAHGLEHVFHHHLLVEVLREEVGGALRARYHRRLAAAYEATKRLAGRPPSDVLGNDAAFLAEHYLLGGDAAGGERVIVRALDYLASGYQHALLLERAAVALRVLADAGANLRCEILIRVATALDLLGRIDEQAKAVDHAEGLGTLTDHDLRGRLLLRKARTLTAIDKHEEAHGVLLEAHRHALQGGNKKTLSMASTQLGAVLAELGDHEAARSMFEDALRLAQELGDAHAEATAWGSLGVALHALADHEAARRAHENSRELAGKAGDRLLEARALANLANVCHVVGELEEERALRQEGLQLCKQLGFRQSEVNALGNIALMYLESGRVGEAIDCLEIAERLARRLSFAPARRFILGNLGVALRARGEYLLARQRMCEALELSNEAKADGHRTSIHCQLARLALEEGRLDESADHVAAARALANGALLKRFEGAILHREAELARIREGAAAARSLYERALEIRRRLGAPSEVAEALIALARCHVEQEDMDAALPLVREAHALAERLALAELTPLAAALLARVDKTTRPGTTNVLADAPPITRAEVHLMLHLARDGEGHLDAAEALLRGISEDHLTGDDLAAFWRNSPVARAVRRELDARRG